MTEFGILIGFRVLIVENYNLTKPFSRKQICFEISFLVVFLILSFYLSFGFEVSNDFVII
jgi:hypothetical protein